VRRPPFLLCIILSHRCYTGTWKSASGAVEHAVEFALKNGYTHVDTAAAYKNEKEVGAGIKASGVPRESIFLTTKLNNPDQKEAPEGLELVRLQLRDGDAVNSF
jgi:diketogulonate reductase-like aldo/keto reductase